MDREAGEKMRLEKETRPKAWRHGRGLKDPNIVTDFRPFAAYYVFLAGIVAYGLACLARDMGWF